MPGTVKVLIRQSVVLVPMELLGETHMQLCFSYHTAPGGHSVEAAGRGISPGLGLGGGELGCCLREFQTWNRPSILQYLMSSCSSQRECWLL